MIKVFIRSLVLGGSIGLCVALWFVLFQTGHFFWGSIVLAGLLIPTLERLERKYYKDDLEWMSNAIMDSRELDSLKQEKLLYIFLQRNMNDKKIKKGIGISELKKILIDSGYNLNAYTEGTFNYLFDEKSLSETHTIYIRGYGHQIPTPKITLKAKGGKLISLTREAVWA